MGSASPRPARTGVGMGRRRVFSLDFPAGGIVLFIHWWGGAEPIGAAIAENKATANQSPCSSLVYKESNFKGRLRVNNWIVQGLV